MKATDFYLAQFGKELDDLSFLDGDDGDTEIFTFCCMIKFLVSQHLRILDDFDTMLKLTNKAIAGEELSAQDKKAIKTLKSGQEKSLEYLSTLYGHLARVCYPY